MRARRDVGALQRCLPRRRPRREPQRLLKLEREAFGARRFGELLLGVAVQVVLLEAAGTYMWEQT